MCLSVCDGLLLLIIIIIIGARCIMHIFISNYVISYVMLYNFVSFAFGCHVTRVVILPVCNSFLKKKNWSIKLGFAITFCNNLSHCHTLNVVASILIIFCTAMASDLTPLDVNNKIVKMRPVVGQAKFRLSKKLIRQIKTLNERK